MKKHLEQMSESQLERAIHREVYRIKQALKNSEVEKNDPIRVKFIKPVNSANLAYKKGEIIKAEMFAIKQKAIVEIWEQWEVLELIKKEYIKNWAEFADENAQEKFAEEGTSVFDYEEGIDVYYVKALMPGDDEWDSRCWDRSTCELRGVDFDEFATELVKVYDDAYDKKIEMIKNEYFGELSEEELEELEEWENEEE
ncbi:hypothetical protein [Spiroplasma clarkii]|uniref:Uncharacterized protein n=1 Tax=Spiroplasma clarkii TaxID=2139 RepID=A0A2K8KIG2_9MOLU|nr:hypothetical protein [Spiroplasma clarkii]ATX71485.1 hypothetical protein SCLAR_v1c11850 [Spiroplasma clarkii]